jgi:phosphatidylethanolamine/phosphatidyl-N-methylethanolamine N-methyltransferase
MAKDLALFIGEMIRRPNEVGAVAPSSAATAQWMCHDLANIEGPIVEIGPGTGSFTRAILNSGVTPDRLTLLEMGPRFCDSLRDKFPGVTVLNRPGQEIDQIGLTNIGAIISGVPMLARPELQRGVLEPAFRTLAPGGSFTQFTYSIRTPFSQELLQDLDLQSRKLATVWGNLPPATIYRITRR